LLLLFMLLLLLLLLWLFLADFPLLLLWRPPAAAELRSARAAVAEDDDDDDDRMLNGWSSRPMPESWLELELLRQDSPSPPPPPPPRSGFDRDDDDEADDRVVLGVGWCALLLPLARLLLLSRLRGEPLGVAVPFLSAVDSENSRRLVCGVRPGPGELLVTEPRPAGDGDAVWAPFRRLVAVEDAAAAAQVRLPPRAADSCLAPRRSGLSGCAGAMSGPGSMGPAVCAAAAAVMTTAGGVVDSLDFILYQCQTT
jgi:hypothetical protein